VGLTWFPILIEILLETWFPKSSGVSLETKYSVQGFWEKVAVTSFQIRWLEFWELFDFSFIYFSLIFLKMNFVYFASFCNGHCIFILHLCFSHETVDYIVLVEDYYIFVCFFLLTCFIFFSVWYYKIIDYLVMQRSWKHTVITISCFPQNTFT